MIAAQGFRGISIDGVARINGRQSMRRVSGGAPSACTLKYQADDPYPYAVWNMSVFGRFVTSHCVSSVCDLYLAFRLCRRVGHKVKELLAS